MIQSPIDFSIIVPARNEAALIGGTLQSILTAVAQRECRPLEGLNLATLRCEVIVVDNRSDDATVQVVQSAVERHAVRLIHCNRLKAPCARNAGAAVARGKILVFVDADTLIPALSLERIEEWVRPHRFDAGLFALSSREPGFRATLWWVFWNQVRRLPLARAKAMPAFMFCTRQIFEQLGPFDEDVVIGEEWPILAGLYRMNPKRLIYDRSLVARSSSRRMELQRFGYLRNYLKYLWAILHRSGRIHYADTFRTTQTVAPERDCL